MAMLHLVAKLFLLVGSSYGSDISGRGGIIPKRMLNQAQIALLTEYASITTDPHQELDLSRYRNAYISALPLVPAETIRDFVALRSMGFKTWNEVIVKVLSSINPSNRFPSQYEASLAMENYALRLVHSFSVHPIFIALGIIGHPSRVERVRSAGRILFQSRFCRYLSRKRLHFHMGFMLLATMDESFWTRLFGAPEIFDLFTPFRGMARLYRDLAANGLLDTSYYPRGTLASASDLNSAFLLALTEWDDKGNSGTRSGYIGAVFHIGVHQLPNWSDYSDDGSLEAFTRWFDAESERIHFFLKGDESSSTLPGGLGVNNFVVPFSPVDRQLITPAQELLLTRFIGSCLDGRQIDVEFLDGCRFSALMRSIERGTNTKGELRMWLEIASLKPVGFFGLEHWIERQVIGNSQEDLGRNPFDASLNSYEIHDWIVNHPFILARRIASSDNIQTPLAELLFDSDAGDKYLPGLLVLSEMDHSFWRDTMGTSREKADSINAFFRVLEPLRDFWKFFSNSRDQRVLAWAYNGVVTCAEEGLPRHTVYLQMKSLLEKEGQKTQQSIAFRERTNKYLAELGIYNEYAWDRWCDLQVDAINLAFQNISLGAQEQP